MKRTLLTLALAATTVSTTGFSASREEISKGINQLGLKTLSQINRNTPQLFASGRGWREGAAGLSQIAALHEDGTIWVAGESYGYSGVSARGLTPIADTGTAWLQLSGSGSTYLARRADGTLWGWGYSGWGTLGYGSTADRFSRHARGNSSD